MSNLVNHITFITHSFKNPEGLTKEGGIGIASDIFNRALQTILADPLLQMETPGAKAVLRLGQTIMEKADPDSIKVLAEAITLRLWLAVEELRGKKWSTQAKEKMWLKFGEVRSEESLMHAWNDFVVQCSIVCESQKKWYYSRTSWKFFLKNW